MPRSRNDVKHKLKYKKNIQPPVLDKNDLEEPPCILHAYEITENCLL